MRKMKTSVTTWLREWGVRVTGRYVFISSPKTRRLIPSNQIESARIIGSRISPLALVIPAIAGFLGGAILHLCFIEPTVRQRGHASLWLIIVPIAFLAYAAHELWAWLTQRQYRLVLTTRGEVGSLEVISSEARHDVEAVLELITEHQQEQVPNQQIQPIAAKRGSA